VDRAVTELGGEGLVHSAVLVDERESVESRARDSDLKVVAGPRSVEDVELERVGERLLEGCSNRQGVHGTNASDGHRSLCAARGAGSTLGRMRIFRTSALVTLGFSAGFAAAAAIVRNVLPSRGDAESDEIALVAVFDGVTLRSRAEAFRGGSMLSWFGGIAVDLREATLVPEAHLSVHSLLGGIAIRVPPGWRVESKVKAIGGGVALGVPEPEDEAAPRLVLDGFTLLGGVAVGARPGESRPVTEE
jgi:hypothetical protein